MRVECVFNTIGCSVWQVFKYLESLDVEDFKDVKSGYSISFVSPPHQSCYLENKFVLLASWF